MYLPNLHCMASSADAGWFPQSLKTALQMQAPYLLLFVGNLSTQLSKAAAQTAPWMYPTRLMPPRHNMGFKSSMSNDTSVPGALRSLGTAQLA